MRRVTCVWVWAVLALGFLACSGSGGSSGDPGGDADPEAADLEESGTDGDAGEGSGETDGDREPDAPDGDAEPDASSDGDAEPDAPADGDAEETPPDGDELDAESEEGDVEPEEGEAEADGDGETETEAEAEPEGETGEGTEEETGLCQGPCDPLSDAAFCWDGFAEGEWCHCDSSSSRWQVSDCGTVCLDEGHLGAVACALRLDGTMGCLCLHDCTDTEAVQADCEDDPGWPVYTNCTCAAADPCGWAGNAFCDRSYCSLMFPSDHFDDSADCDEDCGDAGAVQAMCAGSTLNNCTCAAADPCGWADNDVCESECATLYPSDHFTDTDCR